MWTLFVFIAAYPYKRGNPPPEHPLVFIDSPLQGARDRYYAMKGAYPEAHGMANFEGSSRDDVWTRAFRSGFIHSADPRDADADHICAKQETLVLEEAKIRPNVDGLYCKKCNTFCSYVESNQANGAYLCPDCR